MTEDETTDEITAIEKKAKYFFNNKKAVHIVYKTLSWHNGYIKEFVGDGFLLDEFKDGEVLMFYVQLKDIQQYTLKSEAKK